MWIVISILVFLIIVVVGAFAIMAVLPDDEPEDITETRPWPPYHNPYDSTFL